MDRRLRQNHQSEELSQEGFEYAPSEESDVQSSLRDKIRSQATRLRSLEQYRVLCEDKILELCPGHPIPIKQEHMGQIFNKTTQELFQAQQTIARLEQQVGSKSKVNTKSLPAPTGNFSYDQLFELYNSLYYQHSELQKDKIKLEETLRAEVLNSEEQRTLIEVLKQALENRMQELGIPAHKINEFLDFQEFDKQSKAMSDEIHRLQNIVMDQDVKMNDLNQQLANKKALVDQMKSDRQKIDVDLQEAAEALQFAEEEVQRLEEEKTALIDYVTENSNADGKYKTELEELQKAYDELQMKLQYQQDQNFDLEDVEQLKETLNQMQASLEQVEQDNNELRDKNDTLFTNNQTLKSTLQETQEELDNLRQICWELEQKNQKDNQQRRKDQGLQQQYEDQVKKISQYKQDIVDLKDQLKQQERQSKYEIQQVESKLDFEKRSYQERAQELRQQLELAVQAQQDTERQMAEGDEELQIYRNKVRQLAQENEELLSKNNSLSEDLRLKKKEVFTYTERLSNVEHDLRQERMDMNDYKSQIADLEGQLYQQRNKTVSFNDNLEAVQKQLQNQKEENSLLRDKIANYENQFSIWQEDMQSSKKSQYEKEDELQTAQLQLVTAQKELKSLNQYYQDQKSEIQACQQEILSLKNQLHIAQQVSLSSQDNNSQVQDIANQIYIFCSNFGAVSQTSKAYTQITSENLKDQIYIWSQQARPDLNLIKIWIKTSQEELEALVRRLAETRQELDATQNRLGQTRNQLESISVDEGVLREKEHTLRVNIQNIENSKNKYQIEREQALNGQVQLQEEVSKLRLELSAVLDENSRLKSLKTNDSISFVSQEKFNKTYEDKHSILVKEKKDLEKLVNRFINALPIAILQKIFTEMLKTRNEIELLERERDRIEKDLMYAEGEMRSKARSQTIEEAVTWRREVESLRQQLSNCEQQVGLLKRKMAQLDEELQDQETRERRKITFADENEIRIKSLQEQLDYRNKELERVRSSQLDHFESPYENSQYDSRISANYAPSIEARLSDEYREDRPRPSVFDKLSKVRSNMSEIRRRNISDY